MRIEPVLDDVQPWYAAADLVGVIGRFAARELAPRQTGAAIARVADRVLAEAVARVARAARAEDLLKPPGIAESLDWTEALLALGARSLSPADLDKAAASLGAFVKYREDQDRVAQRLAEWAAAG